MPQVEATLVIQQLLKWISRVDAASRANESRPPFADEDGGDIYPEGPWWLTNVARRTEEEQKANAADVEDAAPSEVEEGQPAEVSDEDPLSDADEPSRHHPILGWTHF